MKYPPVDNILPRSGNSPEISAIQTEYADALDQVVNFGTHVLSWQFEALEHRGGNCDPHLPVTMLLRHVLQLVDAISTLTRHSQIDANRACLRALLEAVLAVDYILQQDSERRGMAFMTCHFHDRIAAHETADPTTERGKQFVANMEKDIYVSQEVLEAMRASSRPPGVLEGLRDVLKRPAYREYEAEYQKLRGSPKAKGRRAKSKGKPPWYSFFDGPRSIQELAERLNHQALYELVYRPCSDIVHASGPGIITGRIVQGDQDGEVAIIQMRNPRDTFQIATFASTLSLKLYRLVLSQYVPEREQDLAKWYVSEIRALHRMPDRLFERT